MHASPGYVGRFLIALSRAGVILLGAGLFMLAKRDIDRRRLEEMKATGPRYTLRDLANKNRDGSDASGTVF